jgi:NADH-quinone oxidoreductase subunit J
VILLGSVSFVVLRAFPPTTTAALGGYTGGTAENLGRAIFVKYLWPFEITSVLVLIAIMGAVVLAYKEID